MKFTTYNFLFIISILITCSIQEKILENNQEQNEEAISTGEQLLNSAESQLGSQSISQIANETEEESLITAKFPSNYFVGDWLMYGYTCNKNTPNVEKCSCAMKDKIVICTKTVGDDCVTTGTETFRSGNLPEKLKSKKNIAITYVVGTERKPNSGKWRNSMSIVNGNEFRSQKRRYVRISQIKPAVEPTTRPSLTKAPFFRPIGAAPVLPVAPKLAAQRVVYFYANYFLGNWNGVGYICDENTPTIEVVNIKYNKGNMYATKLIGDVCVPAKKLSFEAPIPGKLYQGLSFPIKFTVGSPKMPAAKQVPNTIRIIDMNTFEIPRHIYYRVIGPDAPKPHGVYINMKPIVGKGAYPGPNVIKLNPKTNMRSPVRRFVIVEESTRKPANC